MKKTTKKIKPIRKNDPLLNKKQLERRKFIDSIRVLVKKARKGDIAAAETLKEESAKNEDYRQIVKRIIDTLDLQKNRAIFDKVDYKKESRSPQHWPLKT